MTAIGEGYAQALYSLAKDEGVDKVVMEQLQMVQEIFQHNSDFLRLLSVPSLSKQERCGILDACFRGKVHIYVLNLLKILTEKGRLRCFEICSRAFYEEYNRDNGIVQVCAVTAVPLDEQHKQKLKEKLMSVTGKKIQLTNQVDPSCLGGVRLKYGGRQIDGTIQNRMDTVAQLLKDTAL